MRIIYLDNLTAFSLLTLMRYKKGASAVFYESASAIGKKLLTFFAGLKLISPNPQRFECRLSDIRDQHGVSSLPSINNDSATLCLEVGREKFKKNDFLKSFDGIFDPEKLNHYFEKSIAGQVYNSCVFIYAVKWHLQALLALSDSSPVVILEKKMWSEYLRRYGQRRHGIHIISYTAFDMRRPIQVLASRIRATIPSFKSFFKLQRADENSNTESAAHKKSAQLTTAPMIGVWYAGWPISFDLDKRSNIFWLLKSHIPYNKILLYCNRTDVPVSQEYADRLKERGVSTVALSRQATRSTDVPVWRPGIYFRRQKRRLLASLFKEYFLLLVKFRRPCLFYLIHIYRFIAHYAYFYDFYRTFNIKIDVDPNVFNAESIPKNMALEHLGGISLSYQFSNIWAPSLLLSSCADVQFTFSPAYWWVWKKNHSQIKNLISCGYITDYSFDNVKASSTLLRKQLIDKGVTFTICFFDENSSDDKMSMIPNERSASIYRYFIKRLLEDKTLGIIFKPGYPRSFNRRLPQIRALLESAIHTGRCLFLDDGIYVTEKYPTEAAQSADICVALLLGGTAGLEAYLSGVPTVFLDMEGLYSHPLYRKKIDGVVFNDIEELFSAVDRYRKGPSSMQALGDLSSWVQDKDTFRDGNASLRMGRYIHDLLETLDGGKTNNQAIRTASDNYLKLWGTENISLLS